MATIRPLLPLVLVLLTMNFAACKEKGPAERAGERIDQGVEDLKEGENPLKEEGPAERLGEEVDEAVATPTPE